ncbi:hypothetical protein KKB68_00480, partial [Patescibacteria group bacterium]|nr:hypothetical protein [Patescibacteria group bacterium]
SFGDIVGGNLVDLTITVAIATFFNKGLSAKSKIVQTSAMFTVAIAVLPLLLILDGVVSRGDGMVLILCFFFYIFWIFSKRERFTKAYNKKSKAPPIKRFKVFIRDLGKVVSRLVFLLVAAEGIVRSAQFFAQNLNLPIVLIGVLIVGFANAIPEISFAILLAKKHQIWMILGNLMGSVIVGSTLVLGIVALIHPIEIVDFSHLAIARFFLVFAALFFFFFVRSDRKITKKEAIFLLSIYILFVVAEIFIK